MSFYTYVMASQRNGTLYAGSTDDRAQRVWDHKCGNIPGFTAKYGLRLLVCYEQRESREEAFRRERQIKEWKRQWKLELIERFNPEWRDLSDTLEA